MEEEKWWPSKNEYDPKINKEKWIELLDDRSIFYEENLYIFACFYDYGGVATCKELANRYGGSYHFYNLQSSKLAHRIINKGYCKRPDLNDKYSKRWPVLFIGHDAEKERVGDYVWKVRDELMDALKEYGIEKWLDVLNQSSLIELINKYKKLLHENKKVALDDERYKWELITNCKNVSLQKFVELAVKENVSNTQYVYKLKDIVQQEPENFKKILDNLFDEKKLLNERLKTYYDETKKLVSNLHPESKNFGNDERMASVFLTCKFPNQYTFYKNSYYQKFCEYLNVKSKEAGEKYEHYLDLINLLLKLVEKDAELVNEIESELAGLEKSSLLIAQNIVYTLLEKGNINIGDKTMENKLVNECKSLLLANHNIILHGAPGTGKTYLAKEIASAMGEKGDSSDVELGFVQFHPSYDYTDFVEGLRPKNGDDGQIGFERKDGVFKEFCKKAIESIDNGNLKVDNFDEAWEKLIDKVRCLIAENNLLKIGKWEYGLSQTESLKYSSIDSPSRYTFTMTKDNIYATYQHKQARPKGGFQKDMEDIVQYMKDNFGLKDYVAPQLSTVNSQSSTPYVFIIDEINRGEISKIFGELFFSIDPGYRGEKGLVQTQYQNLVEEGDIFKKGFFIPENVYIIGTMNDIDRSVESMDFAMRRRFAFHKVSAKSTQNILDNSKAWEDMFEGAKQPDFETLEKIKNRMDNLNYAIWHRQSQEEKSEKKEINCIEGLSDDFHIGAAYFLKYALYANDANPFKSLWENHLKGLLKEYLRGSGNENQIDELEKAYNNDEPLDETKVELLKDEKNED